MLVLSRKVGQRIEIGENITVVIQKISGNRISIGIDAPRDVRVVRGELAEAARQFDDRSERSETLPLPATGTSGFELYRTTAVHRAR